MALNHLNDNFARQLISKAAPLLQFDFHGHQPDAFTALMDELADRPLQPPEYMDCFDPRERFQTEQCLSGTEHLAREELEIYGVVACCPRWTKTAKHPKQPTTQANQPCNIGDPDGVCISFTADSKADEHPKRRANLKAHLEAMFISKKRFEEVLEEDQECIK